MTTHTHTATTRRIGSSDYGHVQPVCTCGWSGVLYSRRNVEGYRLAKRDASAHERARTGVRTNYDTPCPKA